VRLTDDRRGFLSLEALAGGGAVNLLEKRLLVVSGKGGVGKSLVAAALALVASRRGRNTLLVEMDTDDRFGDLFEAPAAGDRIEPLRENVSGLNMNPRAVMEEFFRQYVRVRAVYNQILDSRIFNYFYEAAPALKEIICLAKVYRLVTETSWWSGRPKWDTVVFDAPATGHGLGLLNVPEAASHILIGTLKSHALKIRDLLRDPATTALNIVTIPEEMPVNEAVMLYRKARDELRVPFGYIFLNAVFPERFTADDVRELEKLDGHEELVRKAARAAFGPDGEVAAPSLVNAARFAAERGALSARYRREVRERIDLPAIEVPYLFTERFGFREVERVAGIIENTLGGVRAPKGAVA
jgi:anion-transporting  ArsA/GET3 family ATPase